MASSQTIEIDLPLPDRKKQARPSLLAQLEIVRNRHREERQSLLANLLSSKIRPRTGSRKAESKDTGTANSNVMTRRRYGMTGNFIIHQDRRLELSGKTTEFSSRKLTTSDMVRLFQREGRINQLNCCEQVTFKHVLSSLDRKDFTASFLSTIALTASRRTLESPSKPQTASTFLRKSDMSRTNSAFFKTKKPFFLSTSMSANFQDRLYKYQEFLLLVNLSNRVYRNLQLELEKPIKYSVDKGNNPNLVKSVMARRWWWEQSDKNPVFVWSQLKNDRLHAKQKSTIKSYAEVSFPTKEFQQSITSSKQNLAQKELSRTMALRLLSQQDWEYLSNQLDGQKGKFGVKIRKFEKLIKLVENPYIDCLVTNHLKCNGLLGNKKAMFLSLKTYYELIKQDVWKYLPQTYHIKGLDDPQFDKFCESYYRNTSKIWIIKPGEYTNRGNGITIKSQLAQITKVLNKDSNPSSKSKDRTFIVQHYLSQPFLYHRRKFDIRAYMMVTCSNGILKGYWYEEGYIRTSGHLFSLDELNNNFKHLTNDAIQKYSDNYGKYEKGNKISYGEFQRYLESINSKHNFMKDIYPSMKKIASDALKATGLFVDPTRLQNNFQIFGLDFMVDSKFKTYLIEINTNPCLETGCPTLDRVIPNMLENAFRLALDPIFPPPRNFPGSKRHYISENAIFHNSFELVYDQVTDGKTLQELFRANSTARKRLQEASMEREDGTVYGGQPEITELI